jgi:hypothetical protein
MDYTAYQLTDVKQIKTLRQAHGERFLRFEEKIYQRLRDMPTDCWIDYTAWVHPQNVEMAVKVICYYIEQRQSLSDYYTFNRYFTKIQRTKLEIKNPK